MSPVDLKSFGSFKGAIDKRHIDLQRQTMVKKTRADCDLGNRAVEILTGWIADLMPFESKRAEAGELFGDASINAERLFVDTFLRREIATAQIARERAGSEG